MADEEQRVEQEVPQPDEHEERARHMGWRPKDEYRGDPDKWVDAKTFVEKGENIMPILKERNRALETKVGEMERVLGEMREWATKSEQRAYERAMEEIKAQKRQAVEMGDVEAFEAAEARAEKLTQSQKQPETQQPKLTPEIEQWRGENKWIDEDAELQSYAMSIGQHIAATKPHLRGRAYLEEVKAMTQKAFPEKFGNPKRNGGPSVESAAAPAPKKKERGYSDLPAEAKQQCARFEKSIKGFTREEYVKNFDWSGYEKQQRG